SAEPIESVAPPTTSTGMPLAARWCVKCDENRDDRIDPITATPTAPPICRVVSLTADPTPAFARGSEPMIESVAGAMTLPMPSPRIIDTTITHSVLASGCSMRNRPQPKPTIARPVPTTALLPNRLTHTLLSGAATMIVAAWGSSTAPALMVEYPSTDCRYCVRMNSTPNSAKNATVIAPLAALNRGFWKKCMFSIGLGLLSSQIMKATSTIAPMKKPVRISGAVQPCDGASMIAHRNAVNPTIDSSAPSGSSLGAAGSRDSGTRTQPATSPMITIGTFTRNTEPHQKCASRKPPVIGPRPMPSADTPAQIPMAFARSRGSVNTLVSTDSVDGMMNAPPIPMSARVKMRWLAEPANADSAEPTPNTDRPKVRNR